MKASHWADEEAAPIPTPHTLQEGTLQHGTATALYKEIFSQILPSSQFLFYL